MNPEPFSPSTSPEIVFENISISNRRRISKELYEELRDAILCGALPAGYAFPNENELCKKLDIGRSTLREAYAPLETMHLITRTKTGTYVNGEDDIKNSMNFDVIAQNTDPNNMIEYRMIFEVGIARQAAKKASRRDILALNRIVKKMECSAGDNTALTQLDFDFHSTLARITGNELLVISFNTIRLIYEKFVLDAWTHFELHESLVDHRALIAALKANDSDQAGFLMQEHLNHIAKGTR